MVISFASFLRDNVCHKLNDDIDPGRVIVVKVFKHGFRYIRPLDIAVCEMHARVFIKEDGCLPGKGWIKCFGNP